MRKWCRFRTNTGNTEILWQAVLEGPVQGTGGQFYGLREPPLNKVVCWFTMSPLRMLLPWKKQVLVMKTILSVYREA